MNCAAQLGSGAIVKSYLNIDKMRGIIFLNNNEADCKI